MPLLRRMGSQMWGRTSRAREARDPDFAKPSTGRGHPRCGAQEATPPPSGQGRARERNVAIAMLGAGKASVIKAIVRLASARCANRRDGSAGSSCLATPDESSRVAAVAGHPKGIVSVGCRVVALRLGEYWVGWPRRWLPCPTSGRSPPAGRPSYVVVPGRRESPGGLLGVCRAVSRSLDRQSRSRVSRGNQ
jgi:hypothetical protein